MRIRKIKLENFVYMYICFSLFLQLYLLSSISSLFPTVNLLFGKIVLVLRILVVVFCFWDALYKPIHLSKFVVLMICFSVVLIQYITIQNWGMFDLIFIPLYLGDRIDYKKLFTMYFDITVVTVLLLSILSILDLIPSYDVIRHGGGMRYALGFGHPNQLGMILFNAVLAKFLSTEISYHGMFAIFLTVIFLVVIPNSITNALGTFLIFGYLVIERLRGRKRKVGEKFIKSWFCFAIFGLLIIIWAVYYGVLNTAIGDFVKALSGTFYTRFTLGQEALDRYGISLFGQTIEQVGFEQIRLGIANMQDYFTVDCLYYLFPIKYGAVPSLVFAASYVLALYKSVVKGNMRLTYTLSLFLLLAVSGGVQEFCMYLMIAAFGESEKTENLDYAYGSAISNM